jgi:hypothetical protein
VIITEELRRPHAAPARHVAVNDRGWIDAAVRPIITDHRQQVARLRLAAARREHLRGRLVDEQAVALQKLGLLPIDDRLQIAHRAADPARERRAIDGHAPARHHLRLAIERKVIGVFLDEDIGKQRFARQTARHHMRAT